MINIVSNKGFHESKLISYSKKIGYKLPTYYVEFLQQHNGGYMKNSTSSYYKNGKHKFILTSMFGLGSEDDLISQFEQYKSRIPDSCIPVGRDAGGNLVCLNLSDDKYGNVYFWDHEEEFKYEDEEISINNLYIIAETFKDFLKSIKEDNMNESNEQGYKVKKISIDPDFLKELEDNSDK